MYCRNCGKEMDTNAVVCVACGCEKTTGENYCPNCGKETNSQAAVCVNCGVSLKGNCDKSSKGGNFRRSRDKKILSGVFAGLTKKIGWKNPWALRALVWGVNILLSFIGIGLVTGSLTIIAYIVMSFAVPYEDEEKEEIIKR